MTAPVPVAEPTLVLLEGRYWRAVLNRNQSFLGRAIVYLSARAVEDPLELTADERDELWNEVLPRLVGAIRAAFEPDRMNYAQLSNRLNQVHWHVVPRYEAEPIREFAGKRFRDRRPGRSYARSKKRYPKDEVLERISAEIRRHL